MTRRKILSQLFFTFLKIGAFTFGGGYAMIALLENQFVSEKKWIEKDEFLDIIAIAESTPGPIAINSATYIGYKMAGVLGSALSTLGVVLPSFLIIYVISLFFDRFMQFTVVERAFKGIQVCVVYLIFTAGLRMMKGLFSKKDKASVLSIFVFIAVFLCCVLFSVFSVSFSSVLYILIAGTLGVLLYGINRMKGGEKA